MSDSAGASRVVPTKMNTELAAFDGELMSICGMIILLSSNAGVVEVVFDSEIILT